MLFVDDIFYFMKERTIQKKKVKRRFII